jgi:hypothetical protein
VIISVDLAAKYSALCEISEVGIVTRQDHSWGKTEGEWVDSIVSSFYDPPGFDAPKVLALEDLPHGVPYRKIVKDVLRLQGKILQSMYNLGLEDTVVFVPPQVWQMTFPGVWRGAQAGAEKAATALNYEPPQLLNKDVHGKDRTAARKTMGDYCDAFLIGRYMFSMLSTHQTIENVLKIEKRLQKHGQD